MGSSRSLERIAPPEDPLELFQERAKFVPRSHEPIGALRLFKMAAPRGHLLNLSVILFFGLRGTPFICLAVCPLRVIVGKSTSPKSDGKVRILGRQFTGKSNELISSFRLLSSVFNLTLWLLLVFSVTPFKIDQNKNQNRPIDKVQNLENERRYIYKDPAQDSGQRNISYTRYPKKCFSQTYRFLWSRHAGTHPDELQHGRQKPTETSVTEFCYKSVNLFFEKLINIKVILFLIHKLFR